MSDPSKQHGAFSWNELMTNDVNGAKTFYGQLFGWQFEDVKPGEMDYTLVKVDGRESAGMMGMPPDAGNLPPNWGAYVTVDDVDARAKQAEALGGRVIVPPNDIPGIGRFCVILDPQGAALSLITYVDKPAM